MVGLEGDQVVLGQVGEAIGQATGTASTAPAHDYRVKITLDGRDAGRVDDALAWLAARMGDAVVRTD